MSESSPHARPIGSLRNVVLVGPSGSGKTTLVERLLVAIGVLTRPGTVVDGTTVSDRDAESIRQQRSVSLSVAPVCYDGTKVNLIDTPGYADFIGEVRAGLRAADCAVFVIAANESIDATRSLWRECDDARVPRAVAITKLDHGRADYAATLEAARQAFGEKVLPLYLPAEDGLIGLLSPRAAARSKSLRAALIEGIIEESEDEELMERYVDGEVIDTAVLITDLERAVARGSFFPVIPVSAATGMGIQELLELAVRGFPAPPEHPLPEAFTPQGTPRRGLACDPAGPLLAEVVKTTSDPYVGRVNIVRVFSGTLRPDTTVHVSGHFSAFTDSAQPHRGHPDHDEDERIGALSFPLGRRLQPASRVMAGDIGAVGRLSRAETGDTLSDKSDPLVLKPWTLPEPLLPVAIAAHARTDEDKLGVGLQRLAAEDPTLRIEQNPETHQIVLWCMGEAHAAVVLDALAHRYGANVDTVDVRIPLRETFAARARGHGRHVKQSGGHGQYAVCDLEVEPLPQGSGFEFVDKVVGGAVPRQFIASVEKGVAAQMARGLLAGHPVVDIRVTLVDGKAHSVDSSDMAFQAAGGLALRDAAEHGSIRLLEPVDAVTVTVPDALVGTVLGDLSARRGRVLGTDHAGGGQTLIRAEVPQAGLVRYAVDLRSLTHGGASFTRSFARYECRLA